MINPLVKADNGSYEIHGELRPEHILREASSIMLGKIIKDKQTFSSATDAAEFLRHDLGHERNEHFAIMFLDQRHGLIAYERLFSGTINAAAVYPRVVVQKVLEHNAAAIIMAHNHPSGCPEPSASDLSITNRLRDALDLVEVRTLDHIVVSSDGHVSLAERGDI